MKQALSDSSHSWVQVVWFGTAQSKLMSNRCLTFSFLKPLTHKSGSRNDTHTSTPPTFLHSVKTLWVYCKEKFDCFVNYYLFVYSFIYLLWCWIFNVGFHTCQASAVSLSYSANPFPVIWKVVHIQASHRYQPSLIDELWSKIFLP